MAYIDRHRVMWVLAGSIVMSLLVSTASCGVKFNSTLIFYADGSSVNAINGSTGKSCSGERHNSIANIANAPLRGGIPVIAASLKKIELLSIHTGKMTSIFDEHSGTLISAISVGGNSLNVLSHNLPGDQTHIQTWSLKSGKWAMTKDLTIIPSYQANYMTPYQFAVNARSNVALIPLTRTLGFDGSVDIVRGSHQEVVPGPPFASEAGISKSGRYGVVIGLHQKSIEVVNLNDHDSIRVANLPGYPTSMDVSGTSDQATVVLSENNGYRSSSSVVSVNLRDMAVSSIGNVSRPGDSIMPEPSAIGSEPGTAFIATLLAGSHEEIAAIVPNKRKVVGRFYVDVTDWVRTLVAVKAQQATAC